MMGRLTDMVYDVLFHPSATMQQIAAEKRWRESILIFFSSLLIFAWTLHVLLTSYGMGKLAGVIFIVQVIFTVLLWLGETAFCQLAAEFLGGRGSSLALFSALGYACLPRIFMAPLAVAFLLVSAGGARLIFSLLGLLIVLWILTLHVKAIQGACQLPVAKAVLVLISPMLLLLGIVLVLGIGMAMSMLY